MPKKTTRYPITRKQLNAILNERHDIIVAIQKYHYDLNNLRHDGVAASELVGSVMRVMKMPWRR